MAVLFSLQLSAIWKSVFQFDYGNGYADKGKTVLYVLARKVVLNTCEAYAMCHLTCL